MSSYVRWKVHLTNVNQHFRPWRLRLRVLNFVAHKVHIFVEHVETEVLADSHSVVTRVLRMQSLTNRYITRTFFIYKLPPLLENLSQFCANWEFCHSKFYFTENHVFIRAGVTDKIWKYLRQNYSECGCVFAFQTCFEIRQKGHSKVGS